jgi:LAS superfamily LD-carboxypeptidase LdcB
MKRQKERSPYGLLALLALLLGLGIQLAMGRADYRRETAEAERILAELGDRAESAAGEELLTRQLRRAAGEDRAAEFPAGRRAAAESGDPTLLLLVNQWNQLPEDYAPELELVAELDGRRYELDRRCSEALWDMLADCAAAGGRPYICSAYRSAEDQQKLYQDKVRRLEKDGVSREDAPELAAESVALPGTSEHQLGLAVDIIDEEYPFLDEGQEETATQIWLMENSWRYGFILRYPNGTTEQTGIIYEPWHYRYVGREYAEEIHRMDLTLEEYLLRREGR